MMIDARNAARPIVLALALSGTGGLLTACAPLVIGGAAATTAVVVTDRRSSGTQLDDKNLTYKIESQAAQKLGNQARVAATVYEGRVLLTGDVPTQEARAQAEAIAKGVEKVKSVVNQLNVGPAAPFSTRSNDSWISSKVRTALVNAQYVPSGTITVTTERGVVYLMGKVTQAESDYAANAAAGVSGVTKVVKVFDIISREEALRLSGQSSSSTPPSGGSSSAPVPIETTTPESGDTGIQAMPIK